MMSKAKQQWQWGWRALSLLVLLLAAPTAQAVTPRDNNAALGQALTNKTREVLFARDSNYGFSLGSSSFAGRSSGTKIEAERGVGGLGLVTGSHDKFAELEGDQRVYALLVDGKYDFNYDLGTGLPLHPYLDGGVGLALYETAANSRVALGQEGATVPLFRVGGGVVFKLGAAWDLSLNYKAGYTGTTTSGSVFTGRSQEAVDLQSLDMGLKLKF